MLALAVHFFVWTFVLILIEAGAFTWVLQLPLLLSKNRIPPKEHLDLDEDVLAEEKRVADSL